MTEKAKKAIYQGSLEIGERELSCAVLEDGTRVLISKDFLTALGRPWKGSSRTDLPNFLGAKNLIPFVSSKLEEGLNPILYKNIRGQTVLGFKAEILPLVCDVYLKARDEKRLTISQKPVAKQAEILMRALAHIGIIALVDEATGYQEVRDRQALQIILDKYIRDEWAKWTKRFPDEFYKELFRLRNIPYPPDSMKKPRYIGHWTNDLVYKRLAPGVIKALREKNPRLPTGQRKYKHHQYLTEDLGIPELQTHLSNIVFLMRGCTSWDDFKRRLERSSPKYGDTISLDFEIEEN